MMKMYFHFGVEEVILFDEWKTTDWQGILGSAVGIIIFGAIFEGLKNYRENLFLLNQRRPKSNSRRNAIISSIHIVQTFLHMIQLIMGYFLMFIFMTYNVWLGLSVVIGIGLGYWIFAWNKYNIDNTECCT